LFDFTIENFIMTWNFRVLHCRYKMFQFGVVGEGNQYIVRGVAHSALAL
jgi:hypothetical protein